jgi:hypothetical protein
MIVKDGQNAHGEAADLYFADTPREEGVVENCQGKHASKFFARQGKFVVLEHRFR